MIESEIDSLRLGKNNKMSVLVYLYSQWRRVSCFIFRLPLHHIAHRTSSGCWTMNRTDGTVPHKTNTLHAAVHTTRALPLICHSPSSMRCHKYGVFLRSLSLFCASSSTITIVHMLSFFPATVDRNRKGNYVSNSRHICPHAYGQIIVTHRSENNNNFARPFNSTTK